MELNGYENPTKKLCVEVCQKSQRQPLEIERDKVHMIPKKRPSNVKKTSTSSFSESPSLIENILSSKIKNENLTEVQSNQPCFV